jgi:hypothetical protein
LGLSLFTSFVVGVEIEQRFFAIQNKVEEPETSARRSEAAKAQRPPGAAIAPGGLLAFGFLVGRGASAFCSHAGARGRAKV